MKGDPPLAGFQVRHQPWMKYAACADMDTETFFDPTKTAECKAICKDCPVRIDCAEQAMEEEGAAPHGRYGYRGCLTATQRKNLHRLGGLNRRDPAGWRIQQL